ncbi:MAG TPA: hypothetical protein VF361_08790 [Candidatus Limnocylindrales bacterium]
MANRDEAGLEEAGSRSRFCLGGWLDADTARARRDDGDPEVLLEAWLEQQERTARSGD